LNPLAEGGFIGEARGANPGGSIVRLKISTMTFHQTSKHQPGGNGSPSLFATDAEGQTALDQSAEIKPGVRAIRMPDGRVAILRNASKKPGTFGHDLWHGGSALSATFLRPIAGNAGKSGAAAD